MDFVAIDFETADPGRASACAIGLALVEEGNVVAIYEQLIWPPVIDFMPLNVETHGVTALGASEAPKFDEIWPDISAFIGNRTLVAHGAGFDMSFLRGLLAAHDLPWPGFRCACTHRMAEELLPGLPDFDLVTLTDLFGIQLKQHGAGGNAAACAEVACRLLRLAAPRSLADFATPVSETSAADSDLMTPAAQQDWSLGSLSIEEVERLLGDARRQRIPGFQPAEPDGRFLGMRFVFTGDLTMMSRVEAEQMVRAQGGVVRTSVSPLTQYVIVGAAFLDEYHRTGRTARPKLAKAIQLVQEGHDIRIIGEAEFLARLE
jgi:DNA polymerase-3 subunit epsilon